MRYSLLLTEEKQTLGQGINLAKMNIKDEKYLTFAQTTEDRDESSTVI
jgi:hypothetical protein